MLNTNVNADLSACVPNTQGPCQSRNITCDTYAHTIQIRNAHRIFCCQCTMLLKPYKCYIFHSCIPPTHRQNVLLELCVILYALPLPPSKSDYCYTLRSCGFVCLPPVAKLRVSFFSMTPPPPQNAMLKHHHLNSSIPQMEALDIQHCLKGEGGAGAWSQWLACILRRGPTQTTLYTRQGSSERGLDLIPMLKQKLTLSFATGWEREPVVSMYPAQRSHTDNLAYKAGIFTTWPRSHSNAL